MAFRTSIFAKSAGLLLLAAMITLSAFAGIDERATASVVDTLRLPPEQAVSAGTPAEQPVLPPAIAASPDAKSVTVIDTGLTIHAEVYSGQVAQALEELNIQLASADRVTPSRQEAIAHGGTILVERARTLTLIDGGESQEIESTAKTIQELLDELDITLEENDRVEPAADASLPETGDINVIRVTTEEAIEEESIPFDTITTDDNSLEKGTSVIDQEGENGLKRLTYEVTYEDGEELERELIEEEVLSEATPKKVRRGTKVAAPTPAPVTGTPTGNIQTGRATYYWGPTAAASTTLPRGTKVRVTNTNTGRSLDVVIDDTGGFSYPTVIDLRSDLFQQLGAPLSAGVIPVTVEVLQ